MIRFFLYCLSWVWNLLPRKFHILFSKSLGLFLFYVLRFRRKIVLDNLTLAFGKEKSPEEIYQLARKNYIHYGFLMNEFLLSVAWTEKDFNKNPVEGYENIEPYFKNHQGGFILSLHLGNWEILAAMNGVRRLPMDVITKYARSLWLDGFLDWYRKRRHIGLISEKRSIIEIIKSLGKGRFVVMIMDQFTGPPIAAPVKFFGKQAGTATALATLSERQQYPIIPIYCYRDESYQLRVTVEPPMNMENLPQEKEARIFEKTQRFNDKLEEIVRKYPEQWLWLHKRWKDFKGESKWKVKETVSFAALLLLVSCTLTVKKSDTGFELPKAPEVAIPEFRESDEVEEDTVLEEAPKVAPKKSTSVKKAKAKDNNKIELVPKDKMAFGVGERAEIDLSWGVLSGGKLITEVLAGPKEKGRDTFLFVGRALSSRLMETIYKVDNTLESIVDRGGLIPYKYVLSQVETPQVKKSEVDFDHVKKIAHFRVKRVSQKFGNQDINRKDSFIPGSRDLYSAFYYARTLDYRLNKSQSFFIYENGQNWEVILTPVANEVVVTKAGAFQCWKIAIKIKLNNIFKQTGDVYGWLSDDSKKYLVKFEAKVQIGTIVGTLVSVKEK
jgi:KDO2-lipid IV(A) lauroyltransferase